MNNTEKDFSDNFQPDPVLDIFYESWFPYRYNPEFETLKKRGGIYKVLAYIKLFFG